MEKFAINKERTKTKVEAIEIDVAQQDVRGHSDRVHPSPYLQAVLNYPSLILCLGLIVVLPLSYLGLTRFSLSDPTGGQVVKETPEARQAHAFAKAAEETQGYGSSSQRVPQQTKNVATLRLYYVAGSSFEEDLTRTKNVVSLKNIEKIKVFEKKLLSLANFSSFCLRLDGQTECAPIRSCIPYITNSLEYNKNDLNGAIDFLYEKSALSKENNPLGVKPDWFFEQAKETTKYKSYIMRTEIRMGAPLEGYNNWEDQRSKQLAKMKKMYLEPYEKLVIDTMNRWNDENDGLHLIYHAGPMFTDLTTRTIMDDLMLTIGSLSFIFVIMMLHTGSIFLAFCGLFQVLLSFPVALCLYSIVFQIKLFGVLQVAGIFIILGIGADDVFILTDALKQVKSSKFMSREERFARAFSSSFTTMLTTSMTTSFAFGMTIFINVPTIRFMGVFAMIMVLCNFIMVCTVYLSCLVLWDKYIKELCTNKRGEKVSGSKDRTATEHLSLSKCFDPYYQNIVAPIIISHPYKIVGFFALLSSIFLGFASQFREPATEGNANPYWPTEHYVTRYYELGNRALRNSTSDAGIQVRVVFGIETIDRTGTDPTDDTSLGIPVYVRGFDATTKQSQEYIVDVCNKISENAQKLSIAYDKQGVLNFQCFMEKFKKWRIDRTKSFPVPKEEFLDEYREFLRRNASKEVRDQVGIVVKNDQIEVKFVNLKLTTTMPMVSTIPDVKRLEKTWRSFLDSDLPKPPTTIGNVVFPVSYQFLRAQALGQAQSVAWTSVGLSIFITLIVLIAFTRNWQVSMLATFTIGLIVLAVIGIAKMLGWSLDPYVATCITILVGFSVDYTVHMAVAFAEAGSSDAINSSYRGLVGSTIMGKGKHVQTRSDGVHVIELNWKLAGNSKAIMYTCKALEVESILSRQDKVVQSIGTMAISVTAGALSTAGASAFLLGATFNFFGSFGIFILSAVSAAYIYAVYFFPALLSIIGPEGGSGKLPKCPCRAERRVVAPNFRATRMALGACALAAIALLCAVFVMAYAPTNDDDALKITDNTLTSGSKDAGVYMPSLNSLKNGWHELKPGGRTSCSRGSQFSFFFKRGKDTSKVILEFMGGGACWNKLTCGLRTSTFNENIEGIRSLWLNGRDSVPPDYDQPAGQSTFAFNSGIEDPSAPTFKDWSHIYIPYCTGDLHWGDNDVEYLPDLKIRHRGAVNAGAAVEWMVKNFVEPEAIFVTGCSAGSYASIYWASKVGLAYQASSPKTKVIQFGDSGAGITTKSFDESFISWNSAKNMPWEIFPVELQGDKSNSLLTNYSLVDFYFYGAKKFPNNIYSQFNAAYDNNQAFFWLSMLHAHVRAPSEPSESDKRLWSELYRLQWNGTSTTSSALLNRPNYFSWTGWGDNHCVIPYNRYWYQTNGNLLLSTWVNELVNNKIPKNRIVDCSVLGNGGCDVGLEVRR
jgi:predicted RND superfamily exporter protein